MAIALRNATSRIIAVSALLLVTWRALAQVLEGNLGILTPISPSRVPCCCWQ
jgi:hypothetical protein